jgi:cytochrome c-type biogenesis protein
MSEVAVGAALLAGVLSFVSPCCLPLVPAYLAVLTGDGEAADRGERLRRAGLFILGFGVVFIVLGMSAGLLGPVLLAGKGPLAVAGGVVLILLGFALFGVVRLPGLALKPAGPALSDASAIVMGVTLSLAWIPCIGPVLGAVLTLAASRGDALVGAGLLAVYTAGLAVPFLLVALAGDRVLRGFKGLRGVALWGRRIAGGVMILFGVLVATGTLTRLNAFLVSITPDWLWSRL